MHYPVKVLPDDAPSLLEQLGTKEKAWFEQANNGRLLFKQGRPGTGENWAEKVSCEICTALQIPHAFYDLATWRDRRGVVSPSFVPDGFRLVLGNELLARVVKDYDAERRYSSRLHTVRRAMIMTQAVAVPLGTSLPELAQDGDGADIFVAYLMLDALIGNQDRHHENWGFVASTQSVYLAPTFDHASSLGRNETDASRTDRLTTRDAGRSVSAYVAKARSAFYPSTPTGDGRPLTTLDAFLEAARMRPRAAAIWLDRLAGVCEGPAFADAVQSIPPDWASQPARDFALGMLRSNSDRLLSHRRLYS